MCVRNVKIRHCAFQALHVLSVVTAPRSPIISFVNSHNCPVNKIRNLVTI